MDRTISNISSTRSGSIGQTLLFAALLVGTLTLAGSCKRKSKAEQEQVSTTTEAPQLPEAEPPLARIAVEEVVSVSRFFSYLEQIVRQHDSLGHYTLSEHLLLRANPWILDTLVNTDYYIQMARGNFVFEQKKMTVLKPGDTLLIPGPKTAAALLDQMSKTWLDLNIPAYTMRIMEGDSVLHSVPVRVGKNQKKYLQMAGNTVDLRTRTGTGEIMRVNLNPMFFDPVTGKKYKVTKRDDLKTTAMPQIPWLEPSINGQRYGQLIHPTTNPRTLGKAASNGCIGTSEADAWRVYFFAPLGTKVHIRYDLMEIGPRGDTLHFEDIYRLRNAQKPTKPIAVAGAGLEIPEETCICDPTL
jgi:Uncharacterized protein conserved in bacteria